MLIDNMKSSSKLGLAFALFLLPIGYLLYTAYIGKQNLIDFARTEIAGARYIDRLRSAEEALVVPGAVTPARAADLIKTAQAEFGPTLGMLDGASAVLEALGKATGPDYAALRVAVLGLIGKVADGSNLTLDTDLDSFYLMDAVTGKIPDLVNRLTDLAAGSRALSINASASVDDKANVMVLEGGFAPVLDGLGSSLASAFKANKDGATRRALANRLADAQGVVTVTMAKLHRTALEHGQETTATEIDAAIGALSSLGRAGSDELLRLLQARTERFRHEMLVEGLTAAGLFGAAVIFAVLALQRGMVRPLKAMTSTMGDLAADDLTVVVPGLGRGDEIGAMAAAVQVFKDNALRARALEQEQTEAQSRRLIEDERLRAQTEESAAAASAALVVRSIGEGLERLAARDLTFRLTDALPPAYEKLRADYNNAVEKLAAAIEMVAENTGAIRLGSDEIASAANDLSSRTEQQAARLEETAAALDQITATVRKTAESAMSASLTVSQTKVDAEQSGRVVKQAIDAMSTIEHSSRQIVQIIGVIDEIAFQTNLLALNAGVEAARAGDAGRGFAVVASEVRALAQRSADAAKQIKTLISSSSLQVQTGAQLVNAAGTSLGRIVTQIAAITASVADMATAAKDQANGLHEVSAGLNHMDQVTQQNAAMVEQSTAASLSLAQQTQQLGDLIQQFDTARALHGSSSRIGARHKAA